MNNFTFTENITLYPTGVWVTTSLGAITRSTRVGVFPFADGRSQKTTSALSSAEKSRIDGELRTKIRLDLKDMKVNFAQVAAEWQKTSDLVTSTATSIYNAYKDLKRGNFAGAARGLGVTAPKRARRRFTRSYARNQSDAVAAGWLELQYGWKPLLMDVKGAAEHAARLQVPTVRKRVRRTIVRDKEASTVTSGTYEGSPFHETTIRRTHYRIIYVVEFSMSASLAHQAATSGLTNPAAVAWELVPFSFVVDWFYPIGDMLASLDATAGLSFSRGCVTTFEKSSATTTRIQGSRSQSYFTWDSSRVGMTRMKLSDFPRPSMPPVKNPVSVGHALNAIALLQTLRK